MTNVIVALDLPTAAAALRIVDRLEGVVDYFKVGSQLFTRAGPRVVRALRRRGKRVFLDLKFHDIPTTVAGAVQSAASLGVDMLTVHASGGSAMLGAARDAAAAEGPRLLGVTLLTSFSASDVEEVWAKGLRSLRDEVNRLAALSAAAGLDGVVASVLEAAAIKRRHGQDFLVATPGIRPSGAEGEDQARTATPARAVRAGADFLVIGRPITAAPDPRSAAERIQEELLGAGVAT